MKPIYDSSGDAQLHSLDLQMKQHETVSISTLLTVMHSHSRLRSHFGLINQVQRCRHSFAEAHPAAAFPIPQHLFALCFLPVLFWDIVGSPAFPLCLYAVASEHDGATRRALSRPPASGPIGVAEYI